MPSASQLRWSPLQGCGDFEYAQETAKRFADYRDMGTTARLDHGAHPYFRERSGALLAVLFFYAAQRGLDMEWVYARCASGNAKALNEVVNELNTTHHRPLIASALEGIITSAGPEMSGVMSTAAGPSTATRPKQLYGLSEIRTSTSRLSSAGARMTQAACCVRRLSGHRSIVTTKSSAWAVTRWASTTACS